MFERGVIALERIAGAMEGATVKLAVDLPGSIEAAKKGRKRAEEPVVVVQASTLKEAVKVEVPRVTVIETAPAAPAPSKNFLEEDEPTVAAAPVQKTPEEYRKLIRQTLQSLQTLTTPEFAFGVLKDASGVESLAGIPADKFESTLKAAQDAVAKAQKRAA